jgi:hypothetical protein
VPRTYVGILARLLSVMQPYACSLAKYVSYVRVVAELAFRERRHLLCQDIWNSACA